MHNLDSIKGFGDFGKGSLGVAVDKADFVVGLGEGEGQREGDGSFADAAFTVADSDFHAIARIVKCRRIGKWKVCRMILDHIWYYNKYNVIQKM